MRGDYLEILFDIVKDNIDKIKPEIKDITGGTEGLRHYVNNNFGPNGRIERDDLIEYVDVARMYFLKAKEITDLKEETVTLNKITIVNTDEQEILNGDQNISDAEKGYIIYTELGESVDFREFFTVIKYLRYIGAVGRNLKMRILCRALRATTESLTNRNLINGNVICMLDCFYSMIKKEYCGEVNGKKMTGSGKTLSRRDRLNRLAVMKPVLENWADKELMEYLNKDENQEILKKYLRLNKTRIEEDAVSYYKEILNRFVDDDLHNVDSGLPELSTEDRLLIYFKSIRDFGNRGHDSFKTRADVKIYCYFLFFGLTLISPNLYNLDAFDKLFVETGYDSEMTVLPYIHSAVTYLTIIKQGDYKGWINSIKEENEYVDKQKIEHMLDFTSDAFGDNHDNDDLEENEDDDGEEKGVRYDQWLAVLKRGYDNDVENDEVTRFSIKKIKDNLVSNADMDENILKETYSLILDAEYRRVWYFNRLIYKILASQARDSFIRESKSTTISNEFKNQKFLFSWKGTKSQSNIIMRNIAKTFNFCFSDDGVAFADMEWREKSFYLSEQEFTEKEYDKSTYSGENVIKHYLRFFKFDGRMVGRQFLLLTALLCKLYNPEDIDLNYVNTHLLTNSRFAKLEPKYSDFDQYFESTFKLMDCQRDFFMVRLSALQTFTRNYEESILNPADADNTGPLRKIMENIG